MLMIIKWNMTMDRRYLARVMRLKTMSREEEYELLVRYKKTGSQEAKDKIVAHFMKLVVSRAKRVMSRVGTRSGLTIDDMISEGVVGLLTAIEKFDIDMISKHTNSTLRLSTYADTWVRVMIFGDVMRMKSMVYNLGSGKMKSVYFKLPKLAAEMGWDCENLTYDMAADIASKISHRVTPEEVLAMSWLRGGEMSLDSSRKMQNGESKSMMDMLRSNVDLDEEVHNKRLAATIREEIARVCSKDEASVIESRLFADDKKTLQEISDEMKISTVQVKQLEKEAGNKVIAKLTERFAASSGAGELDDDGRKKLKKVVYRSLGIDDDYVKKG